MNETLTQTRADEIAVGDLIVEPADHMVGRERRWEVTGREVDPYAVVLWFRRVGGGREYHRVHHADDMLTIATPTPTRPYLIEVPGGLGGGEVEARSLSHARELFEAALPDKALCSKLRVVRGGVGIVTVTTTQGQDIDVRFTQLS